MYTTIVADMASSAATPDLARAQSRPAEMMAYATTLADRLDTFATMMQAELDELRQRALTLAKTPFEGGRDFLLEVLDARVQGAELALRASQSALLHQGARGYLMSAAPQRRIREAHFVAIVTPAIKHLRWEMARLMREEIPS